MGFHAFCFAVYASDVAVLRKNSADGWTRQIELDITLNDPVPWEANKAIAEEMLRVLSGDFWTLHFLHGGPTPPKAITESATEIVCHYFLEALIA